MRKSTTIAIIAVVFLFSAGLVVNSVTAREPMLRVIDSSTESVIPPVCVNPLDYVNTGGQQIPDGQIGLSDSVMFTDYYMRDDSKADVNGDGLVNYGDYLCAKSFIASSLYVCPLNCELYTPVCGDTHVDTGEQCDDGNQRNNDGCSSSCQIEIPRPIIGANLNAYVPPAPEDCDISVPSQYSTIQAGIDAAVAGDTVCVGAGVYNEDIAIRKTLRLSGSGAASTTINGLTDVGTIYIGGDTAADNTIVEGFLIRGVDATSTHDETSFNIGPGAIGVIIRYNWIIAGNGEIPVRADSNQRNMLAENNVLEGSNSLKLFMVSGVQGPSNKVDFLSNTFVGTINNGVALDTWATDSLIQRNAFHATGTIAVLVSSAYPSTIVSENNFSSIAPIKVGTYSGGTLIAQNNWWGDLDPSDNIWGDINYTPFATEPFEEYP